MGDNQFQHTTSLWAVQEKAATILEMIKHAPNHRQSTRLGNDEVKAMSTTVYI